MVDDLDPPLPAEEAAPLIGIRVSKLYALAHAGDVPHLRIGRSVRFTRQHIAEIRDQFTVRPERAAAGVKPSPVAQLQTRHARGPQRRPA